MNIADQLSRRWAGRLGVTGFVIAALALGRAIGDDLPDSAALLAEPHQVEVGVGETAQMRTMQVTVESVQLARTVVEEWGTEKATPGVFVVAELTSRAGSETAGPTWFAVTSADGSRVWENTRGLRSCLISHPGLEQRCSVAIEVPPEELEGMRLLASGDQFDQRYDSQLVLDLGLTPADAEQAREGVELTPREVRVPPQEEG